MEALPRGAARGAEIRGVDVSRDLPGVVIFRVLDALHTRQALVCRGQELSGARQLEFAQWFGPLHRAPQDMPVLGDDDQPSFVPGSNTAEGGMPGSGDLFAHLDMPYPPGPLPGARFYAVALPPSGGDTSFANPYQAYEERDVASKALAAGLQVWS